MNWGDVFQFLAIWTAVAFVFGVLLGKALRRINKGRPR